MDEEKEQRGNDRKRAAYEIRLPGFMAGRGIGLGDVVKRATSAAGFRPCGGCNRRAEALNRWLSFSGRRSP